MSLRVELDKELERRFRELAMRKYGYSKGAIKKATEVALRKWSGEEETMKPKKTSKNPVDSIVGLLGNIKHRSSVEEQHEIRKIWSKIAEDR